MSESLTARDDGHEWSVQNSAHRKVAVCTGSAAEANARRLAAAWNFTEGVETAVLKQSKVSEIVACEAAEIAVLRAANANFLDAVTGDKNPALHRLAWLENLLDEICESQFIESHDDPSSAGDMVRECRDLARLLRAAANMQTA